LAERLLAEGHRVQMRPDISTGGENSWGVRVEVAPGESICYWDLDDVPSEMAKPDRPISAGSRIEVTLDRMSAAMAVGELLILARAFEPIDGQYAARLQAVCDAIVLAMTP
jgi:hypothetical protein